MPNSPTIPVSPEPGTIARPEPGSMMPDFDLPADDGPGITLNALRGEIVVLFFYPKDDTTGCTDEAIQFSALATEFASLGARVYGVSKDDVKSHRKFRAKHGLKVPLLSDADLALCTACGIWVEKSMYGRKYMGVERTTFLIDRQGRIAHVWAKVKIPGHAAEVLEKTRTLRAKK